MVRVLDFCVAPTPQTSQAVQSPNLQSTGGLWHVVVHRSVWTKEPPHGAPHSLFDCLTLLWRVDNPVQSQGLHELQVSSLQLIGVHRSGHAGISHATVSTCSPSQESFPSTAYLSETAKRRCRPNLAMRDRSRRLFPLPQGTEH